MHLGEVDLAPDAIRATGVRQCAPKAPKEK
jgi:hypothetical protein